MWWLIILRGRKKPHNYSCIFPIKATPTQYYRTSPKLEIWIPVVSLSSSSSWTLSFCFCHSVPHGAVLYREPSLTLQDTDTIDWRESLDPKKESMITWLSIAKHAHDCAIELALGMQCMVMWLSCDLRRRCNEGRAVYTGSGGYYCLPSSRGCHRNDPQSLLSFLEYSKMNP